MLLEEASDAIFVADSSGQFLEVNRAACDLLGYTRDELVGLTFLELGPPSLNPGQTVRIDQMRDGRTVRSERTARRKDGSTRHRRDERPAAPGQPVPCDRP